MNKQTENGPLNEGTLLRARDEFGYQEVMTGRGFIAIRKNGPDLSQGSVLILSLRV